MKPSWRDRILDAFVPQVSKLTLVADPDRLLTEEKLALALRERGFELIDFDDPVAFRYAYESGYRARWDQGEQTDLVVILRLQDAELERLPYDLLQAGRTLSFNLGELFPRLSYPVIETLDRSLLDALYAAQTSAKPDDRLGDNATKDFILRHLFGVAAELICNEVDLLRALLRLHYGQRVLPATLAQRLIQWLETRADFESWPLAEIVPDAEGFFAFLQERWPVFLLEYAAMDRIEDRRLDRPRQRQRLRYPGPARLPFDHHDIRVYVDDLFLEGRLTPVAVDGVDTSGGSLAGSWMRGGIIRPDADDEALRIARLFERLEQSPPADDWRHSDWTGFALKWAELAAKVHGRSDREDHARLCRLGEALNRRFAGWLTKHYASLINLSPTQPAMLHHVARHLARRLEGAGERRLALILVDGLALDQWVTVRQALQAQDTELLLRESAVFAWIPTLTSVSRQALFAGKPPLYFPGSIQSTHREEALWKQFWEGHGLSRLDVGYQRCLGDGDALQSLDALIHGKTRVLGLVVDKVDEIMHGMQLGAAGMHNQIQQWLQGGFLTTLIARLLERGFEVWLTADHGNVECIGKGRPQEGVIAETRGERARVYPTADLRAQVAEDFDFALPWTPAGLPPGYFPLLACGQDAFVSAGEKLVAHGGMALEEVLVPLVKLTRRRP
ncbi:BREX-3 system phosphatase PglZ [Halochromatium salexigens]|uniref:Alkaline phosphatase n=1 Tax=Halochromatium salexigens TaxID=49447 RepID=A0AAJ0UID6_HALSE|nr:BREX-3 system phosphatase PglZ [Halochromatium salexigens]MBK5931881.1 alkaline phosphatase [Halochromatium salexigens]